AHAHRVVAPHEHGLRARHGGQAHGGPHVVGEHEEGAADGQHAAVQRHAVHGRGHGVLPDAEVDLAAAGVRGALDAVGVEGGAGVAGEVGSPGDQARHGVGERRQAGPAGLAGGDRRTDLPGGQLDLDPGHGAAAEAGVPVGTDVGGQRVEALLPAGTVALASTAGGAVELEDVVGDVEGLVGGQPHDLLGGPQVVAGDRVAVGGRVVGVVRRGEPDV